MSAPILIGSQALSFWVPRLQTNDNTDWDVISDEPIEGTEWHDRSLLNNASFDHYVSDKVVVFNGHELRLMNPWGLAIIKRSHLWRDLSFQKHITHYHKFMSIWAGRWSIDAKRLLDERTRMTKAAFPQGNPNLMQTKEDFFDDAVKKMYDHDYLHELVAYYDRPLYTRMLRDSSLAWCEEDSWDKLSHADKIKCISEEAHVIAIERFMVPRDWKYPTKLAYIKAVDKVCTTLCSGWFRDYAIDYYPEVVEHFNQGKFNHVKEILT